MKEKSFSIGRISYIIYKEVFTEMNKEELVQKAIETVSDDARIAQLENNIEKMGKPNAADEIAGEVLMLADAYMEKETRRRKERLK